MKRIIVALVGIIISISLSSHPWKPNHYVIIDTDGGIDDMKTITMLLASPDVRVLGITVSPGVLNENTVFEKVNSLLNSFYHEGLPVGINRICKFKSPEFPVALATEWGEKKDFQIEDAQDHIDLIQEIISNEKTKISYICLGGMTTVYNALTKIPLLKNQIKEIIWSSEEVNFEDGFNYKIDSKSAKMIIRGDIPVKIIRGLG